jgi:hypothetical protein
MGITQTKKSYPVNNTRDVLNKYIFNKGDINGNNIYNRHKIIDFIYQTYKKKT